jgi:hypothetical protein
VTSVNEHVQENLWMFRGEEEDLTSCLDVNEKESDSNGREVHLNGPMRKFELHHDF